MPKDKATKRREAEERQKKYEAEREENRKEIDDLFPWDEDPFGNDVGDGKSEE